MQLEVLMERATSGKRSDRRRHFRPSMLYSLLDSPFNVWCDYHAPASAKVDETTRYERMRMDLGSAYESQWVAQNYPEAVEIPQTYDLDALKKSFEAMLRGERVIHAPQLWLLSEELYGMADVLIRHDDHPSDLGAYHYRVVEIKRSKKVDTSPEADDYRVLQAMTYHRILSRLQGFAPPTFTVVLRNGQVEIPPDGLDARLDKVLTLWRSIRDGQHKPELPGYDKGTSPWADFTNKILEKSNDVTLAFGINASMRKKLATTFKARTAQDVERLTMEELATAIGPKVGPQTFYRLEAKRQGHPIVVPDAKIDLPRKQRHFYFDFETCDDLHPAIAAHVYMIGLYDWEQKAYKVFTANGPGEEERIFREFIQYVGNIEDTSLFHWAAFETETITKDVIPRHPSLAPDLERIVKSCVDLKEAIKDKVYFATRTYSIKEVAPSIGFHWKQADVDAYESMMLYWDFLNDEDSEKIARIVQYNRDDVEAMVTIDQWLVTHRVTKGP